MSDLSIPDPAAVAHYQPQALDIQHDTDPADDHGDARRIPHLGHVLLFLAIALVCFFVSLLTAVTIAAVRHPHDPATSPVYIHAAVIAQIVAYALTFAVSFLVFPFVWHRSFLDGISWNFRAARLHWWQLVLLSGVTCTFALLAGLLVKAPKETDLIKIFDTTLFAWISTLLGAVLAPIIEEITFRGFLLPAIATAYDWISLDRTPAAHMRWRQTTSHTTSALVLAAIVSSAIFASIHGFQLHWQIGTVAILFGVALVLSAVRISLQSVAASSLVHISYNSLLMIGMIIQTCGFRHLDKLSK
jgi:membrane protease YdiL (CAAX protease family)